MFGQPGQPTGRPTAAQGLPPYWRDFWGQAGASFQALYRTAGSHVESSNPVSRPFPSPRRVRRSVTPMSDPFPRDAGLFDDLQRQAQRLR